MVAKTVFFFPKRITEEQTKFIEELCEQADNKHIGIEDIKSHSVALVSLEQGNNSSINTVASLILGNSKLEVVNVGYDQPSNTTYVRLGHKVGPQLTEAGLQKVKDLF